MEKRKKKKMKKNVKKGKTEKGNDMKKKHQGFSRLDRWLDHVSLNLATACMGRTSWPVISALPANPEPFRRA